MSLPKDAESEDLQSFPFLSANQPQVLPEAQDFSPKKTTQPLRLTTKFSVILFFLLLIGGFLWLFRQQLPSISDKPAQEPGTVVTAPPSISPGAPISPKSQEFSNQEFGLSFSVPQNYTVHDRLLTQDSFTTEHHYFGYALLENSLEGNSQNTDAASIKISLAKKNYTPYPGAALSDVSYGQMQGYVVPFAQGESEYSHELTILNFKGKELSIMRSLSQADASVVEQLLQSLEVQQEYSGLSQAKLVNDWTQYTVGDDLFSFSLPTEWQVLKFRGLEETVLDADNIKDDSSKLFSGELLLTGPEGEVRVLIGEGFGGGCEKEDQIVLTFMGEKKDGVCHFIKNNGDEQWGNFGKTLSPNTSLSVYAVALAPAAESRETVLEILGTFSR